MVRGRALVGVLMLLGASLVHCEGQDGAGAGGSPGAAGAQAKGGTGTPEIVIPEPCGDPPSGQTEYPAPFVADDCPAGPPPTIDGAEECVTLEQLLDDAVTLSVIGGFQILGSPEAWRCPTIAELMADTGCSLGEGCCVKDAYCGPLERPLVDDSVGGGGAGGAGGAWGGAPIDQHECCYYMVRRCGV